MLKNGFASFCGRKVFFSKNRGLLISHEIANKWAAYQLIRIFFLYNFCFSLLWIYLIFFWGGGWIMWPRVRENCVNNMAIFPLAKSLPPSNAAFFATIVSRNCANNVATIVAHDVATLLTQNVVTLLTHTVSFFSFLAAFRSTEHLYLQCFSKTPTGPPTHGVPKSPSNKKKKFKIDRKPRSPKVNVRSPKVNARSPKVNVLPPKSKR